MEEAGGGGEGGGEEGGGMRTVIATKNDKLILPNCFLHLLFKK